MREFTEENLTEAVVERFGNTPDPRLKLIMNSLVRHLHAFVRDVEPTFDEWMSAINFLTRTGHICTDKRQEFILLSDTLGVSMLVDAINHRHRDGVTETTVLGPFYVEGPPEMPLGSDVTGGLKGDPLYAEGTVCGPDGKPLANATVDVWQSDADGFYDVQYADREEPGLRARIRTDSNGRFYFWSVMPTAYPIPYDGPVGDMLKATKRHPYRPAHLHFLIAAEGYETLITHLFVDGDQYLDSDAVFGVKKSLIRTYTKQAPGTAPDGRKMTAPWYRLSNEFRLKLAEPARARKGAA
ncbi:MAG TPA: intradiol ring-cleavage dioxygenase [Bryobacteraceae bacterium]|nr:intradiol ring-cleavage dioxygenase [Bryobacteraceae bacterium]